jgi:hypothetical protein
MSPHSLSQLSRLAKNRFEECITRLQASIDERIDHWLYLRNVLFLLCK